MMNQFRISSAMIRRMEDVGLSPLVLLRQAGLPIGLFYQEKVLLTTDEFFASHSSREFNETAYLLSYKNADSFFRAFHAWEGTSPGQWRSMHMVSA